MGFILACDAGTTSSRTLIFDENFDVLTSSQKEFKQHTPQASWVEHDAEEIWKTQLWTIKQSLKNLKGQTNKEITAVGITNQRETIVAWDKNTGKSLAPALVWQDQRTQKECAKWRAQGHQEVIRNRTGLVLDPYFSASKIAWLLKNNAEVKNALEEKRLCVGTIDSWLIFKLTRGVSHVTDASNASRTQLMNIHTNGWDQDLCRFFKIPMNILPRILNSADDFGRIKIAPLKGVPITGVLGDQQASLFGHRAIAKGQSKNTYGTGCFMLKNIGLKSSQMGGPQAQVGVLETIAWRIGAKTTYAHEGAVMVGGDVMKFLRDNLGLIEDVSKSSQVAKSLTSNDDVYFVPAFAGLGTPWWDSSARGAIVGLTAQSSKSHIVRAALESIAFQSLDLARGMEIRGAIKVDGGATANKFLMQFQADVLGQVIDVAHMSEVTALGVAQMAAIGAGLITIVDIKNMDEKISKLDTQKRALRKTQSYKPQMKLSERKSLVVRWREAVERSRQWHKN